MHCAQKVGTVMIIFYVIGLPFSEIMVQTKFWFYNELANGSGTRQSESFVFNMPKLMGSVNRTAYHNVDSQGNAQMYTIGLKLMGTKADAIVTAAPDTYYVRRAIKAWHDARVGMYKRAGISMKSLGYGRNLRPYLDVAHEKGDTTEIDSEATSGTDSLGISPNYSGDEWDYTRAAVSVPQYDSNTGPLTPWDFVDSYSFTILGDSVSEANTTEGTASQHSDQDSYVSVGMVAEWLDSFKRKSTPASDVSIDKDNALIQLRSHQGLDKEEVLKLAKEEQEDGRPWDLAGAQYKQAVFQGICHASGSQTPTMVFNAPCGLFNLTVGNSHTAEQISCEIEVLDIRDM